MAARYLRFVRTLALVTGATHVAGCDDAATLAPIKDATIDSTLDGAAEDAHDTQADDTLDDALDSLGDAGSDGDARNDGGVPGNGLCRTVTAEAGPDLPCEAGSACSFPDDSDVPLCTVGIDAAGVGSNLECGGITCGEYCYCAGPAASVCGCIHGAIGPLPPPDLPSHR